MSEREFFKAGGHDFADYPDGARCNNCGTTYREFIREGGGCVTTGPREAVAVAVPGEPVKVTGAFQLEPVGQDWDGKFKPIDQLDAKPFPPSPAECECATWGREDVGDPGHHPTCPHRPKAVGVDEMLRLWRRAAKLLGTIAESVDMMRVPGPAGRVQFDRDTGEPIGETAGKKLVITERLAVECGGRRMPGMTVTVIDNPTPEQIKAEGERVRKLWASLPGGGLFT